MLAGAGLALATSGLEARAGTITNNWPGFTNLNVGPITNNCIVNVVRQPEYWISASSDGNGTINGTNGIYSPTNGYVGLSITLSTGYDLDTWTNVPSSVTKTATNINWTLNNSNAKPWTNVFAITKLKKFNFRFIDAINSVDSTTSENYNTNIIKSVPQYITNSPGVRYATFAVEATDVGVTTNSP